MAQHFNVRLAAVAAAHELQQRSHATVVHHQLAARLAVAGAELNGSNCSDDLHSKRHGPAGEGRVCVCGGAGAGRGVIVRVWYNPPAIP